DRVLEYLVREADRRAGPFHRSCGNEDPTSPAPPGDMPGYADFVSGLRVEEESAEKVGRLLPDPPGTIPPSLERRLDLEPGSFIHARREVVRDRVPVRFPLGDRLVFPEDRPPREDPPEIGLRPTLTSAPGRLLPFRQVLHDQR